MGSKPDYADKFFQARAAQTATRDAFFVALRRFLEKYEEVNEAIVAAMHAAARANCTTADLKPLVRAFARTDYPIETGTQFGDWVATERMPKTRKKNAGDGGDAPLDRSAS